MDLVAVIMAGGSGTRFWPLSRRATPKQFLPLGIPGGLSDPGAPSLLAATVERLRGLVPPERLLIVTAESQLEATAGAVPGLPADALIGEPVGRNTAACVGLAAVHARARDPQAVLAVFPADHHVARPDILEQAVRAGADLARRGRLVTLGFQPSRPETGYGYIEVGAPLELPAGAAAGSALSAATVARFVEKPDLARAQEFLAGGRHLWNAGIFILRADVVLAAIERHLPELHRGLAAIEAALRQGGRAAADQAVTRLYPGLPSISIDHGILEKSAELLAVVRCDVGWSDVGSWETFAEMQPADSDGNVVIGRAVLRDCHNVVVVSQRGVAAVVGLRDAVVVASGDAVLVCPRTRSQEVKHLVDELARRGSDDVL